MGARWRSRRRALLAVVVGAVAVVAAAGYAYGALTATNQTYTGCLSKGLITNVEIGDAPLSTCKKDQTQISWSQTGPPGADGADAAATSRDYKPLEHKPGKTAGRFTAADGPSVTVEVPADGALVVFGSMVDAKAIGINPSVCAAAAEVADAGTGETIFAAGVTGFGVTGSDTYTRLRASETRFVEGGTHTYEMRYLDTGCADGDAYFKERRLAISVLR